MFNIYEENYIEIKCFDKYKIVRDLQKKKYILQIITTNLSTFPTIKISSLSSNKEKYLNRKKRYE